ncbi:Putative oxidoreductase YteT precursor [Pelagimonas phthalicica]|uniref:Putative oxidoreductase YteT n=1 Tax=Pelagimonas phthalicica TaxID=1037362 RepID=A0A238JGU5_9RHOB|nr:Gfo/Idh/MocA family oxidoreductase [Pelagimonas phthalicica]TDS89742.1 putative dehydrogenase [Pelagimonas phthalicica]SMX29910.1 Putative oxidoreductase YteT precursor [Pelagimonas phthalicica]
MTQQFNYGVIGCGMMGQEHLRNINLIDGARVHAIFEPDAEMARKSQEFAPDAVMCGSVAELLALEELDCLLVVSPNYLHVEQLEEIAATRPLPLLMEKPLYTDPEHAARIAEIQASYPAPIWVAMEYRYMPPVAKFLDALEKTTGGVKMLTIREHRFPFLPKVGDWNRFNEKTGGTLVEKCCHFFDLMRLALKSDPVRVMASAGQVVNHLDEVYNGERPDIWDSGYVIVDFANGARAMLELCMFAEGSRYQEELSAVGPDGKIEALVPGPGRFWPDELGDAPTSQVIVSPRYPKGPKVLDIPVDDSLLAAGDHNGSTYYQHVNFLAALRGEGEIEVSLQDGAWAVRMGHAAQQSAATGEAVAL